MPIQKTQSSSDQKTLDFFGNDMLRTRTFLDKYALKDLNGNLLETLPVEMWERVAREIANVEESEKLKKEWHKNFYFLLDDFKFIPGGRILFAAGSDRKSTLLNCYVLPIKNDSIEGIFDFAKEEARTYSYGGGVGTDISTLRPKGSIVHNSALSSTGSVSFMELFSLVTGTIGQSGRRGALMLTINVDHPDVLDFINIKSKANDRTREIVGYLRSLSKGFFTDEQYKKMEEFLATQQVRYANISVKITDEFMRCLLQNQDFTLKYESEKAGRIERKINPHEIWDKLINSAHQSAEPGVMFWDTIKKESTSEYNGMEVVSTNPCSEIPLEPYGCCCLGNINLSKIIQDPFTSKARVNYELLNKLVDYGVRFLDNVLTYSYPKHPLKAQAEESIKSRRIGLGFTGLGSMLAMLKIKYDTNEAINFVDKLFEKIRNKSYRASIELSKEKGSFKLFDKEKHFQSQFVQRLPKDIKEDIKKFGLRNVAVLTVPPVGSGSALAGVSSGVEPIFALKYLRRSESLSQKEFWIEDHTLQKYRETSNTKTGDPVPEYFITSHDIEPMFRIKMQATIQNYIDHAISSTINLANNADLNTVRDIYFEAWKSGCKSITVYREGSREGILVSEEELKKAKQSRPQTSGKTYRNEEIKSLQFVAIGKRYRFKTEVGTSHINITRNNNNELTEVFIEIGKSGSSAKAMAESLGRQISLSLRSGMGPIKIIDQLLRIRGSKTLPNNIEFKVDNDLYKAFCPIFSLPDAIAKALLIDMFINKELKENDIQELGGIKMSINGNYSQKNHHDNGSSQLKVTGDLCTKCGGILMFTNGCYVCQDCGNSGCD